MTSCTYSFDSAVWEKEHGIVIEEHWSWECPQEKYDEDHERCIFHLPLDSREKANISEEELRERFIADILRGDENRLHGAVLSDLSLDFLSLRSTADQPINLRANSFQRLSFANAQVKTAILLDYSILEELDVSHSVFDHALGLQRVEVSGSFSAGLSELDRIYGQGMVVSECDLSESQITRAAFQDAYFDEFRCPYAKLSVILDGATFHDVFSVPNATFEKVVDCRDATFESHCHVYKAEFKDNLRMEESTFKDGLKFEDSTLGGIGLKNAVVCDDFRITHCSMGTLVLDEAAIDGEVWVGGVFEDTVHVHKTTCDDEVWFSDLTTNDLDLYDLHFDQLYISSDNISEFHLKSSDLSKLYLSSGKFESIGLSDSNINDFLISSSEIESLLLVQVTINGDQQQNKVGDTSILNTNINDINWRGEPVDKESEIKFVGGSVNGGNLRQPHEGVFHFTFYQTAIGDVRFHNDSGTNMGHVHFISPEFDDFPFEKYTEELAPDWRLNLGTELDSSELVSETGKLEEYQTYQSARASAERSNQEDARSGFYKREMHSREKILWSRWRDDGHWGSILKWCELRLLDWICGYGEDPGKPVLIAIGTIGVFSVIYAGMLCETGNTAGDSLQTGFILSMQSFATLVFSPDPVFSGGLGRLLTSLEGVIATILIPFLVFALTKSID